MSLIIHIISSGISVYTPEASNQNQWILILQNISLLLSVAFIFVSVLFALFLNLHKFILYGVIGMVSDITIRIIPVFFTYGMYILNFNITAFLSIILFCPIIFLSILHMKTPKYQGEAQIRKEILELGTKYPDFKVKNISKNCESDKNTIVKIVKKMIKNKEIYADYFKISKKFLFNNKANAEEIDRLMEMFSEWETEHIGKKV
ncbi:MAG: hypothetical protein ACTSQR_07420 [Promethearchaeota archaeon]